MKVLKSTVTVVAGMLFFAAFANAQRVDAYLGLGTARDPSSNQLIDLFGTGTGAPTTALGGVFMTLGGGVMLKPSLGVGGEVSFRVAQQDYAGAGIRPIFYDFNGIFSPKIGTSRVMAELQGGLGGVNVRFYGGSQFCDPYTGRCSNFAGSSNHFQLHLGAGIRFYVNERVFIRPQFDYHWVHSLTDLFKNDSVAAYSIAVGISSSR